MVVGARTGKHYRGSFHRQILRKILKFLVDFTTGRKILDINSGLRVFSKSTIEPYLSRLCNTFSFTTSLTLAYLMTYRFVENVPIPYSKRIGSTKVRLFRDSLRTLQFIVEAILFYNPIKIFIVFSGILLFFTFMNLIIAAIWKLYSAFLLGIGFILVSIIIFSIGLLAVLISKNRSLEI